MIDYGLVRRDRCACGLAIVIASNASPQLITATMSYHNATREHRYWATYTQPTPPDSSLDSPPEVVGPQRSGLTSRGADRLADEISRLRQRGGVDIRADGYDFDLERTLTAPKR